MRATLLLLADGRLPAGGHAYSAGVEAAVRFGDIVDEATLERYLAGRLATTGVTEAAFAVAASVTRTYDELDRELTARLLSPRAREVGVRMGRQLLRAGRRAWPSPVLDGLDGCQQPIVLGALAGIAGCGPIETAGLVMHHLSAAVASAGTRLLGLDPLGVLAAQARTTTLIDGLVEPADTWAGQPYAALPASGGALTDILGEDHGRWDARLFVA